MTLRALPILVGLVAVAMFTFAAQRADAEAVLATVGLAVLVVPVAANLVHPLSGAPTRGVARPWGWASLFGALTLLVSGLVTLTSIRPAWWHGPAVALAVVSAVFALFYALWVAPIRAVHRLRVAARDPAARRAAAEALVASFEVAPPAGRVARKRRAMRGLAAAGALLDACCFAEAARVVAAIDPASLDGELRSALWCTRATVHLYAGARDAAFAALAEAAPFASTRGMQDLLVLNDALLEAQDGRGDEALERLGRLGPPPSDAHARSALVARAHALAARGDHEEARRVVAELVALAPASLERIAHLPGPARPAFQEALAGRTLPS